MNKKLSEKDKKDWENFLKSSKKIHNKDSEISRETNITEKTVDLHGYNLRDANLAIGKLIVSSYKSKVKKINVITGKGMRSKNFQNPYKSEKLGILKYSVPHYIINESELMKMIKKIDYKEIENLNSGSFTIYLKTKR